MLQPLTDRQQAILDFIRASTKERRYPPTLREIGKHMGIRSTNGVSDHLRALERKGYLKREDMKSRALVPVDLDEAEVDLSERELRLDADSAPANDDQVLRVPLVGRVAAGSLHDAIEHVDQTLMMDPSLLQGANSRPTFALRVHGDSMINAGIHDGDILFVRRQPDAKRGEIVVALVGDEATVKRYYPEEDHIRLQPENPAVRPIYVRKSEYQSFQIVGVAVGLFRSVAGMKAL
jgi:repressor LexA